jgi:hypothetical protein
MKKLNYVILGVLMLSMLFTSCSDDAYVASQNLVRASDNFEIDRRIVFFNGITDEYLLEVEGKCAVFSGRYVNSELEVICKTGDEQYKKHYFGLSDNTAYFVEQIESTHASAYHYRVTFKPQLIIPDVDMRVDVTDGPITQN